MARQESFIKFKGKIGDLSFYKDRNGYQARLSSRMLRVVKSDPENGRGGRLQQRADDDGLSRSRDPC